MECVKLLQRYQLLFTLQHYCTPQEYHKLIKQYQEHISVDLLKQQLIKKQLAKGNWDD